MAAILTNSRPVWVEEKIFQGFCYITNPQMMAAVLIFTVSSHSGILSRRVSSFPKAPHQVVGRFSWLGEVACQAFGL
ncbi:unnamed protein product [Leuciscus chuanchicus]